MQRSDAGILDGISESLDSTDIGTVKSTCEFLQTVVVHDFPAAVFLSRGRILQRLSCLCFHECSEIAELAVTSITAICKQLLSAYGQQHSPLWKQCFEPVGAVVASRGPGDGQEEDDYESVTLSHYVTLINQVSLKLLQRQNSLPHHLLLHLLETSTALAVRDGFPTSGITSSFAQLETFCRQSRELRTLHASLVSLSRGFCTANTISSPEFISEVFIALLDLPLLHFQPDLYPVLKAHLQRQSEPFTNLHNEALALFKAFENAAKMEMRTEADAAATLLPLMALGENFAAKFIPVVLKNVKTDRNLLRILLSCPVNHVQLHTLSQVCELISPVRRPSEHLLELLLNEEILLVVVQYGFTEPGSKVFLEAEKLLTLLLKSRSWLKKDQWIALIKELLPLLLPNIQQHWDHFSILSSNIWDLMNQSITPSETNERTELLDLTTVLGFLLRSCRSDSATVNKSCEFLVTVLCYQKDAHRLLPRLSVLQPEMLEALFNSEQEINVNMSITAKFQEESLRQVIDTLAAENTDLVQARSSLIQLAVILEDITLHRRFDELQGPRILASLLHRALNIDAGDEGLSIIPSIVSCLVHVSAASDDFQLQPEVLLDILRCAIVMNNDALCRRQCLFLLNIIASRQKPQESLPEDPFETPACLVELWKKPIVKTSCKFLYLLSLGTRPSDIQQRQKTLPPFLQLDEEELELIKLSDSSAVFKETLRRIQTAGSYEELSPALSFSQEILHRFCIAGDSCASLLRLEWRDTFERFFKVLPNSIHDEDILAEVIRVLLLGCRLVESSSRSMNPLLDWLVYIVTNERHVFWVLFRYKSQSARSSEKLWPILMQFVSKILLLMVEMDLTKGRDLSHIIRLLRLSFEKDDQSQVYELNSLKLTLDCVMTTLAAVVSTGGEFAEVGGLLRQMCHIILSFSSKEETNKGRSILQRCAVITDLILAASPACPVSSLLPTNFDWLVSLLQHNDVIVKTASIQICGRLKRLPQYSQLMDTFRDDIEAVLLNPEESCCAVIQATRTLTQFDVTHQALSYACEVIDRPNCRQNPDLLDSLAMLLDSLASRESRASYLPIIANEALGKLIALTIGTDKISWVLLSVVRKIAVRCPPVAQQLSKQTDFVNTLVKNLNSADENLIRESCLLLTVTLVHVESEPAFHKTISTIFKVNLNRILTAAMSQTVENPCSRTILLFLKLFLTAALNSDNRLVQLEADSPALFFKWMLDNCKDGAVPTVKEPLFQVLSLILASAATGTGSEDLESLCTFVIDELKKSMQFNLGLESCLLDVAYNIVVRDRCWRIVFVKRGIFNLLTSLWRTHSIYNIDISEKILRFLASFADIAASKDWVNLLGSFVEFTERKESVLTRGSKPTEDDWILLNSVNELFCAACSVLESRRLFTKTRWWADIKDQWHPLCLKKLTGSQQLIKLKLIDLKLQLLSQITLYPEPILQGIDAGTVETLVNLAQFAAKSETLVVAVLRNMAFQKCYKSFVLNELSVGFFARILYQSQENQDQALMAVAALLSLAANNQRGKFIIKSHLEHWYLSGIQFDRGTRLEQACLRLKQSLGI